MLSFLFGQKSKYTQITIEEAARHLAPEFHAARESCRRLYENVNLVEFRAVVSFSRHVDLRLVAGAVAVLADKESQSSRNIKVPHGKSIRDALLGKQATNLRIYERDRKNDIRKADVFFEKMKLAAA